MKRFNRLLKSKKGSAIMTVLIVMVVLVLLGQAITMLTLGTLRTNVADSSNNEAYYAAESGVLSAIDQVKHEVVAYYSTLSDASESDYNALFGAFSTSINANAQTRFVEPTIEGGSTSTTFYVGAYDPVNEVCEFNIQCISTTPDNARYQVNASVYVKKVDISVPGGLLSVPDNAALVVGGELDLDYDSSIIILGGDAYVGSISPETMERNKVPYKLVQGDLYVDPAPGESLTNPFVYPSYSDPDVSGADYTAITDMTLDGGVFTPPSVITTLPDVTLTLNKGFSNSLVYGQGDVNITTGQYTDIDLYVDGNLNIDGAKFTGNIYCRGNITVENTPLTGTIICDGNFSFLNGSHDGEIIVGGTVDINNASSVTSIAAVGDINISSTGMQAGLVYSSSDISIGNCSISAVIYSYNDVDITGSLHVSGAVFAKNNYYFSNTGSNMNLNYDSEFVQGIVDEANINIFGNGGETPPAPTLDASIFVSEEITPVGRLN